MQLNDLLGHYDELLYLPDKTPVLAALATVAAQDIPGPPVWTLLVGPPSSGKTEIIDSLHLVNGAVSLSTLTKASLLSGRTGGAGGLLLTHFPGGRGLLLSKTSPRSCPKPRQPALKASPTSERSTTATSPEPS